MSHNPFKVGDKVVRINSRHGNHEVGQVGIVTTSTSSRCVLEGDPCGFSHQPRNLRAAVAGKDYPAPITGHTVAAERLGHTVPAGGPALPDPDVSTDWDRDGEGSPAYSPALVEQIVANVGHLPDGSSVQKHSAGPLYPVVLIYRDATLGGGKYDVGIISPRNQEPLWFSTLDAAVAAASIIKEDLK